MVTIIAKFNVTADKSDEFKKCAIDVTRQTKRERGCISYTIFNAREDKTHFTFIEEWLNDVAIEEHNSAPHFKAFLEKITPMLDGEIEIEQFEKIPSVFF